MKLTRIVTAFVALVVFAITPAAWGHYRPEIGRWVERDPLGFTSVDMRAFRPEPRSQYTDGMSLYETVGGSPNSRSDPTGLEYSTISGPFGPVWRRGACWAFVIIDYHPNCYDYINPFYEPTPQKLQYYPLPLDCSECNAAFVKKLLALPPEDGSEDGRLRDALVIQLGHIEGIEDILNELRNNAGTTMTCALTECAAGSIVGTARIARGGCAGGPGAGKEFSRATKAAARAQSGDICEYCGEATTRTPGPKQSQIDHIHPRSRGGNNTIDNAANSCRDCNLKKGAKTPPEMSGTSDASKP